jgi:hypothetical protein
MEFLKKNYEKVLLGLVLLGLTVAACSLPLIIQAKRTELDNKVIQIRPKVKELTNLDLSLEDSAIQRAQSPFSLDLTTGHNLFNPVVWKKLPTGQLLKEETGNEEGPKALVVTKIKELYLVVSYVSTSGTGYFISIERQALLNEGKRRSQAYVSMESHSDLVTLKDVKGPADKPTELTLQWNDTGETITLTPDKPYMRVDGYSADLKYPLEANKVWTDRRVGSNHLQFNNGYYKIVAITASNVVVLDESNTEKYTIEYHPNLTETR